MKYDPEKEIVVTCGSTEAMMASMMSVVSPGENERLCAAPLMEAAVMGLKLPDSYYAGLIRQYTHMKNLFTGGLKNLGIPYTEPHGAYYVLIDISEFGYESDLEFCERMAETVGVGAVPGSSFFRENINHLIRLHFAKSDETLNEALNRLETFREKMIK